MYSHHIYTSSKNVHLSQSNTTMLKTSAINTASKTFVTKAIVYTNVPTLRNKLMRHAILTAH